MKVSQDKLNKMFEIAGISKESLYGALRTMGVKNLKSFMRPGWTEDNPSWGYCYVVSEMVYWYASPEATKPYSMKVPGDPGTHRFLRWPDGEIIDLTCEQFPDYSLVDYSTAKISYFMQTGCKGPSKRAKDLASLLGLSLRRTI